MNNVGIVHETSRYAVRISVDGYQVINKETEVVEAVEKMLPQAILHAENSTSFLVNELWRWVAVQGSQNKDALEKEEAVISFEPDPAILS